MKKKYIIICLSIVMCFALTIVCFGAISNNTYVERTQYIDLLTKTGYKNTVSDNYVTVYWNNGIVQYKDSNGNTISSTNHQISSYIPSGIPSTANKYICLERIEPKNPSEQARYRLHYKDGGTTYYSDLMACTYAYGQALGEERPQPYTNQNVMGSIVNSTIPVFVENADDAMLAYMETGVIDDNYIYNDFLIYENELPSGSDLNFNVYQNDNDEYTINVFYNSDTLVGDDVKIAFDWKIEGYTQNKGYFNLGNLERTNLPIGFDGRNEIFNFNNYKVDFLNANEYLDLKLRYKCYSTSSSSPNTFNRIQYFEIYDVRITNQGAYIKNPNGEFEPLGTTSSTVGIGEPPNYSNSGNTIISGINSILNGRLLSSIGSFFNYLPFELVSLIALGIVVVVCVGIIKAIRG